MVTSTRARTARPRPRRRRNRKRSAPIWRRIPDFRGLAGQIGRGLRHIVPGLVAVAITAGVALGGYYGYRFVTTSERFAVKVVEVRGNQTVSDERISTILDIDPSENIFHLDLDGLADKLEAVPVIATASVSRRLPDTLLIDVVEHRPAALVDLGGPYLADADGHVFKRANIAHDDSADLPVITGLRRPDYLVDPQAVTRDIVRALDAFDWYRTDNPARPALSDINLHPRQGITFITYDRAMQIRVGNGNSDTVRANLRAFDSAWNALTAREQARASVVYADTTNRPDRVTVGFEQL